MAEDFWKCKNCGGIHLVRYPACLGCGGPVQKLVVDDTKSLQKLLGIEIRVEKKNQKKMDLGQG